jgi:DNA-binding NarL/FixJ family response regulator
MNDLLEDYRKSRKSLYALWEKAPEADREFISSMINELSENIIRISSYCRVYSKQRKNDPEIEKLIKKVEGKRSKTFPTDMTWFKSDSCFEDEVINRLSGESDPSNQLSPQITLDLSNLTDRQRETIELIAAGLDYTEAGELMGGVVRGTISKHMNVIREKFKETESIQLSFLIDDESKEPDRL